MSNKTAKIQQFLLVAGFLGILVGFLVANLFTPDQTISKSERRKLKTMPQFSTENLFSGQYFSEFEDYAMDQFVLRDSLRTVNAYMKYALLFQKDNNDIYVVNNRLYKMEYPLNEQAVDKAMEAYRKLIQNYFADTKAKIYYGVIPDKNYYAADSYGYLSLDYDLLYEKVQSQMKDYTYIELRDLLTREDYYYTDLHWDQQAILPVANRILETLQTGSALSFEDFSTVSLPNFRGSYYGQAALLVPQDTLTYFTNDIIENLTVYDYETRKEIPVYDASAVTGVDGYNVFLGGPKALLEIRNSNAKSDRQLVIIRDSFSSSLAPLLCTEYSSVILIDLRYLATDYIKNLIELEEDCDVLFLHNTLILNQYGIFK